MYLIRSHSGYNALTKKGKMENNCSKIVEEIRSKVRTTNGKNHPNVLFSTLYNRALHLGLRPEDFAALRSIKEIESPRANFCKYLRNIAVAVVVTFLCLLIGFIYTEKPLKRESVLELWFNFMDLEVKEEKCLIDFPGELQVLLRPPIVDCGYCENVADVVRVANITQKEYESKYAYTGRPVIITDATHNWTALNMFNFEFFKNLYVKTENSSTLNSDSCQFFPYNSDFDNLEEVFEMNDDHAKVRPGAKPWYIGWENCDFEIAEILRKHYQRPYFLPKLSEAQKTDWLFMGSPGYGATLHIDSVRYSTWQAQITGTKLWRLEPPPECYHQCGAKSFEVTVQPGEIITLDANKWYHSTLNVGDGLSIAIAAEFD